VISPESVVADIDRWLRRFRAGTWSIGVTIASHPYIIHYIQRNRSATMNRWLRSYFLRVHLREDDTIEAGDFRCFSGTSSNEITSKYL
jgi:hypothetical protein